MGSYGALKGSQCCSTSRCGGSRKSGGQRSQKVRVASSGDVRRAARGANMPTSGRKRRLEHNRNAARRFGCTNLCNRGEGGGRGGVAGRCGLNDQGWFCEWSVRDRS